VRPLYEADIVVCDRYFYDTLLSDLAGDVLDEPEEAIERYRRYQPFLPTPDHEFYVQVPTEVSMERKDDIPSGGTSRTDAHSTIRSPKHRPYRARRHRLIGIAN